VKVFTHYSVEALANTFLVAPNDPGAAIMVDPGVLDVPLLKIIEDRGYYVKHILVTHPEEMNLRGIRTIMRVYDATIHAATPRVLSFPAHRVNDGDRLDLDGFDVEVISVPSYLRDAVVYRIHHVLFPGRVLSAGIIGEVANPYVRSLLVGLVRRKILTLPPETLVFPFLGPPTTIGLEAETNPDLTRPIVR
jgi:glyoxylase-like metal-dependent hydrolase (beta-lactamase superfamily II)